MTSLEQVVATLMARQQEAMERQQSLMETLISAVQQGNQRNIQPVADPSPAPSGSSTAEPLMDIIAKHINDFVYDPDENLTFANWFARYEDVFQIEAEQLEDAAKVRVLLRKLSSNVFDKYKDYILPRHPRDVSFSDTVSTMNNLFGRKESQFSVRVKCMQYV